ncbi:MAG: hypothetical protein KGL59_00750 [Acidobacteriota bacterium]|nr:hypothetical protein [Acidobacteriota bacterium]
MNRKHIAWGLRIIGVVALAVSLGALAQSPSPVHLSGLINDYTLEHDPNTGNVVGPWEIRGEWSMTMQGASGTANFSAYVTMEHSDYWTENFGNLDSSSSRNPHTHHITMVGGVVAPITNGFSVTGPISVTGNGNAAFPGSTLEVDITGGDTVAQSNIVLKFMGGAAGHFGSQPVHGVVAFNGTPAGTQ